MNEQTQVANHRIDVDRERKERYIRGQIKLLETEKQRNPNSTFNSYDQGELNAFKRQLNEMLEDHN
jgi:hypothetical protein